MSQKQTSHDVLRFWFEELEPAQWWQKDAELDRQIADRFGEIHQSACRCELFSWRDSARGRLAEIIVLDQFSRNIFRDQAEAFAADPLALALAQEVVTAGLDQTLTTAERSVLYLPYMHSESLVIHDEAVRLYQAKGLEFNLEFEHKHRVIIERFGRYPHRNLILGRESTPEEIAFLQEPDSSF